MIQNRRESRIAQASIAVRNWLRLKLTQRQVWPIFEYVYHNPRFLYALVHNIVKEIASPALCRLGGRGTYGVVSALTEISSDREFIEKTVGRMRAYPYWYQISVPFELYALCRLVMPRKVVETGVASGLSSSFILKALELNDFGRLYSIDLPDYTEVGPEGTTRRIEVRPPGKEPGWLVPADLKSRWDLRLGKSQDILKPILAELGEIDVFLHDSDHTYEIMWFEFQAAWSQLTDGGILLADDIHCNTSFYDFSRYVGRTPVLIKNYRFGGIRK